MLVDGADELQSPGLLFARHVNPVLVVAQILGLDDLCKNLERFHYLIF